MSACIQVAAFCACGLFRSSLTLSAPRNRRRCLAEYFICAMGALVIACVSLPVFRFGFIDSSRIASGQPRNLNEIRRTRAPTLQGGGQWVNTANPLTLGQLRGKIVILDFWTYCCINCLHTLPELKRLEEAYPNQLVVIGVHSPKFANERDIGNLRAAVVRHEVDHPVVNDANLAIARKYDVQGWPSLRVIDPSGYIVATHFGEAPFEILDRYMRRAVAKYRREGTLDETPLRFELERHSTQPTPLRFPGKVLADEESKRLFIADSGHNRIIVASFEGNLVDTIGSGQVGDQDGSFQEAAFSYPQGLALRGDTLYVADTDNHLIRRVDLRKRAVTTIAGNGEQSRQPRVSPLGRPTAGSLASPWALWLHEQQLYIAMAGSHQIYRMLLDRNRIHPYAGNGVEDIVDGKLLSGRPLQIGSSSFAQPSGLASDGRNLFVADSEGSSIRAVPLRPSRSVTTVVGTSRLSSARLFTFGDRDGPFNVAMLQHPLGLAYRDGQLFVADTFNHKVKVIDFERRVVRTIADGNSRSDENAVLFDEPAGLSIAGDDLYVADTNNHRIRVIDLKSDFNVSTFVIGDLTSPASETEFTVPFLPNSAEEEFNTSRVRPVDGQLKLSVQLNFPATHTINHQAPMSYSVTILAGDDLFDDSILGQQSAVRDPGKQFAIDLPLAMASGSAKIRLSLVYYYCQKGSGNICRIGGVDWTGTVRLSADATDQSVMLEHYIR